jgi:hypothetical protein
VGFHLGNVATWTVLLKTPDGIRAEQVEAEVVNDSDDGQTLEFTDVAPLVDAAALLAKFEQSVPKSTEEGEQTLRELLGHLSRIHVASFDKKEVVGHFRGTRIEVNLTVQKR